jgi:hypothetical protein
MSAFSSNPSAAAARQSPRPARVPGTIGALLLGAALACGGCAELPRDANGSPPTARLAPNGVPPAPITAEEKHKLDALNRQVLLEQEAAIARQQQAEAMAQAAAYAYPAPSWNLFYGGWGGGHWGGGVGFSSPGYWGWGGYPYWW